MLETALDKIEPYGLFRGALMGELSRAAAEETRWANATAALQQEQPQFYTSLTSHLSADEQNIITAVCQQAENQALIAQQAAAAEAANGTS